MCADMDFKWRVVDNAYLMLYVLTKINKMTLTTEQEIRDELEEITKELVKLQGQKYRTDIVEKNKEYKELCYKMWFLEERKKNLLNLIKKLHGYDG